MAVKVKENTARLWAVVGAIAAVVALPLSIFLATGAGNGSSVSGQTTLPDPTGSTPTIETPSGPATSSSQDQRSPAGGDLVTQGPPSPTRVPLAVLCGAPGARAFFCGSDYGNQPITVGGRLFVFAAKMRNAHTVPPSYDPIVELPYSTCTELFIEFARDDRLADPGSVANIRVVQTSAGPVVASVERGKVGRLTTRLNRGPFTIEGNATDGHEVFVNGYAVCDTDSGV